MILLKFVLHRIQNLLPGFSTRLPVLWTVIFFLCACQGSDTSTSIATVNGKGISLEEFQERLAGASGLPTGIAHLKPEDADHLREEILNRLIDEKILLLHAEERSLTVSDEELQKKMEEIQEGYSPGGFEKALEMQGIHTDIWKETLKVRMILEKLIASEVNAGVSVSEKEAKDYYDSHKKEYTQEIKVRVAQVFLRDPELSAMILKRLKKGEDFAKVARENSMGLEASRGGDLGFIGRGVMPENIDAAIFSLPTGAISEVIKSPYGYHIFKVLEKEGRKKTFSDIKDRVIADIRKQKEEQAYSRWFAGLKSRAVIKINRHLLKTVAVSKVR
jgi:parvulin-like peptidyl-prolyl isomerase